MLRGVRVERVGHVVSQSNHTERRSVMTVIIFAHDFTQQVVVSC